MKEDITMSRANILQLVALGKIKETDVSLTDEEKEIVESNRKLIEEMKEKGAKVIWNCPID